MKSASIYKVPKKGYLLHAQSCSKSGFEIASDPFTHVPDNHNDSAVLVAAIKSSLVKDESERVPDPKDWGLFERELLQKMGLKSYSVLHKKNVKYCYIKMENGVITFIPTDHAEKPSQGFMHKNEEKVLVPYDASSEEIFNCIELAFSKCG